MATQTRMTLAEYERLIASGHFSRWEADHGHRWHVELLEGELVDMSPMGDAHILAVEWLMYWGMSGLPRTKAVIRVQSPITLPDSNSVPEPDLVWLAPRNYRAETATAVDVLLLIEVADSSLVYDRNRKGRLYAEAGIPEYWLVNLLDRCVEMYREPNPHGYQQHQIYRSGDVLAPTAFPAHQLTLNDFFQSLPA